VSDLEEGASNADIEKKAKQVTSANVVRHDEDREEETKGRAYEAHEVENLGKHDGTFLFVHESMRNINKQ
jgi:hypothetical protein